MAAFNPQWSSLLQARSVYAADKVPVEQAYRFSLLEQAVEAFQGKVAAGDNKDLLDLAAARVADSQLRLSYSQIVGAPAAQTSQDSSWHEGLPVGLLVLVAAKHPDVAAVEAEADSAVLETLWERLGALLRVLTEEINKPGSAWSGDWMQGLHASFTLKGAKAGDNDRVCAWTTVGLAGDSAGETQPCNWLLPALRKPDNKAEVMFQFKRANSRFMPAVGTKGEVSLADPRTLIPLKEPHKFEFAGSDSDQVSIELPKPEIDELSWATAILRRYRARLDGEASEWGKLSLWDAALDLDPPSDDPRPEDPKWRSKCEELNRRLAGLIKRGLGGFSGEDREILISAVWARRLTQMAFTGLSYTENGKTASIRKVKDRAAPPLTSGELPANDDESDKVSVGPQVAEDLLLCAFYLAVRMGGSATSASARSLDIRAEDMGSGVAPLLMRTEQVYVDVANKIKERLRADTEGVNVQTAIEWLMAPRALGFRPGRPLTGVNVFALTSDAPRLVQEGAAPEEIAEIKIEPLIESRLSSAGMRNSLLRALKKIYEKPRPGGLPVFVTDLVRNGVAAGADGPSGPPVQTLAIGAGQDIPDGLKRLLGKGFADTEGLLCHLTSKAKANDVELRGARDIVRLGRRRFIDLFQEEPRFSPELLSRVYSRAWSKTNARAQFIAATRSSEVPKSGGQTPGL